MYALRITLASIVVGLVAGSLVGWVYYQPRLEAAEYKASLLEERVRGLEETVEDLRQSLEEKEASLHQLKVMLEEAQENASRLLTMVEEERRRAMILEEEKEALLNRLAEANETIARLQDRLEELEENLSMVEARLEEVESLLELVNMSVYQAARWYGLLGTLVDDDILEAAVYSLSSRVVDSATVGSSLEDRLYNIMEWVMWNVEYDYDSPVRVVDPENYSLIVWDHYVMLPNETLDKGGGDCDDLALLVYSILARSDIRWSKLYMVAWYPEEGPGHVGVLVEAEGTYYILDPAGNWLNGVSFYLMVEVVDKTDPNYYWEVYLVPLNIDPEEKSFLSENGLATMVYYLDSAGKVYKFRPPLRLYGDPQRILEDWIHGYWGVDPAYIEVIGEGVYELFTSIDSAAAWIRG